MECDSPREEENTEKWQSGTKRLVSGSDSEVETPKNKKLKTKKFKGLNKRDKEEMDRHLAALTRKKDVKLVGACKQPSTSLDAILTKLAQSKKKTLVNQSLPIEPIQEPSNKASTSSFETIEKMDGSVPDPDDDELPDLDEVFAQPIEAPRHSDKLKLLETRKKQLLAKQTEPIEEQSKKNDKKGQEKEKDLEDDNSDSDLEIVDFPSKNNSSSRAPIKRVRSAIKPVVSRSSLRLSAHQAAPERSVSARNSDRRTDHNLSFMEDLRTRSALEGARERKRKEQEFIEQTGGTAFLKSTRGLKNHVAAAELNIKDILQKEKDEDVEMNDQDEEDEDDEDWNGDDDDDDDDDELGSGSEVAPSENEAQEEVEDENENEDNMEEDMPSAGQVVRNMEVDDEVPIEATKRRQLRVVESPEPEEMSPKSPTPIDLTGFRAVPSGPQELSPNDLSLDDNPSLLPGFEDDEDCLPGFGRSTTSNTKTKTRPEQSETNFTQLFEAAGSMSHPPVGLLRQNTENGINEEDEDAFIPTCVLPEVNVLPEERERDMMMMMLGGQKDEAVEALEAQYINDRGLLTQNKPSHAQLPPDSPLFSQDFVAARTPFALRKELVLEGSPSLPRVIERHTDDREGSPTTASGVQRKVGRIVLVDEDEDEQDNEAEEQEEIGRPKPVDAFSLLMKKHAVEETVGVEETTKVKKAKKAKKLDRRDFVVDQADESEEEGGGRGDTEGRSDSDSEADSDAARSIYEALVDDKEDDRDETTKLEGEEAIEELLKVQKREFEEKQQREIQKVIEGKLRKKQAGVHGGGISDSESEDDDEIENVKAQQRFQEQLKKKKKRAIHTLGTKHESFFKSYEETTKVDDDDVSFLQNHAEEAEQESGNEDDNEDDEDEEMRIERKSVVGKPAISIREAELLAIERTRISLFQ
ncbi:hypothetical protein DFH28DRAFT_512 [Melampsora americana]|nr:hypothetical protein DFH28DRAFT_512 [Melampsora americana]